MIMADLKNKKVRGKLRLRFGPKPQKAMFESFDFS
jgi:hypothetical protein